MNRRDYLKLTALLQGIGCAPLLRAATGGTNNAPLRIGYLPITDASPLLVAHHQGLYQAQGIDVAQPRLFRSWAQLVEAFLSKRVDLIHVLSPIPFWLRYGSGLPVAITSWNHINGSALTVRPDIQDLNSLGGQTVAVPFWYSIHNVILQHWLRDSGLEPTFDTPNAKQVKLVVMAPSDMVPSLAAGAIGGFIVAEPFNALAEIKQVGHILRFSGDIWRSHACCVTLMHQRDIDERPEWVQGITSALVAAQQWILANRAQTAKLLADDYTPHKEPVLARVLTPDSAQEAAYESSGAIQHPLWHAPRIGFQPYPFPDYMKTLLDRLQHLHLPGHNRFLYQLGGEQVASELVAPQFVRNALIKRNAFADFGLNENLIYEEEIEL